MSLCTGSFGAECLSLLQSFAFFGFSPYRFLQLDIMGTGALIWEAGCGAVTLCSLAGTSATEIFLPLLNCYSMGVELTCSIFLPLLPVFMWLLLYILSYGAQFS